MGNEAEKSDPKLWEKVKQKVTRSSKGGKSGQWSARKAQLAVQEYKHKGGGYAGEKAADNSLQQWQEEEWGIESGKPSRETGERYLPKKAREALTNNEDRRTSEKKRADSGKGHQFSAQPQDIAKKAAKFRHGRSQNGSAATRAELYKIAKKRDLPGRSRMTKRQLEQALR